jgi:D-glycero-alpha-D-manno-heptose-7-phosphate kinase
LAGGGTDVSPYSDRFGGCVLNVTIDLSAHCTMEYDSELTEVSFIAKDLCESFNAPLAGAYPLEGELLLHKAIYNRVVRDFNNGEPLPLRVVTWADAPPGSGLGTSSTMVVSILSAYRELLNLPLGEYDLAYLAYEIERIDCNLAGGRQDQYAAVFGGFNFMEFNSDDRIIVNPLRIRRRIENELQSWITLYYTGKSRKSADIINDQVRTAGPGESENTDKIQAMHVVKQTAFQMKESLLRGNIEEMGAILHESWIAKKKMASSISNKEIDHLANLALGAGAKSVKITGAGGGGYLVIFAEPTLRNEIRDALKDEVGHFQRFNFTYHGVESWATT